MTVNPELMAELSNPAVSLQMYGSVMSQEYGEALPYDPFKITHHLQETLLGYAAEPPIVEDFTKWLCVLKYRQGGSSTTGSLAFYPKAQYIPGWEHVTIADTRERSDYLFERVLFNHSRWPEEFKVEQQNSRETRQLSWVHGGKMRVITSGTSGAGIGRSPDSMLGSELPLWKDARGQMGYLFPSMNNRRRSQMVLESTPFPDHEPSTEWYRNTCIKAAQGESRFLYAFFPFWDGKLNVRAWPKGSPMTTEEQRLMDRYGPYGLRPEHLAFRRVQLKLFDDDAEVFATFFPFDDVTCWSQSTRAIIRWEHIARSIKGDLVDPASVDGYQEFEPPREGSMYCIGVDPSGHGSRDHAAFQVLEVWDHDWRQVATYAYDAEPEDVAEVVRRIGMRYNRALVGVERNGVGTAITALLRHMRYPNLYVDRNLRPGIHKTSEEAMVSDLKDALRHCLDIRGKDTVRQLRTYQGDRSVQLTPKQVLLAKDDPGRRGRSHWDKVSAMMVAVVVAKSMPQRAAPTLMPSNIVAAPGWTLDQIDALAKANEKKPRTRAGGRRSRYSKRRRRR